MSRNSILALIIGGVGSRMDVDQAARSNAQEYFGVKDPDYYEFEGNMSQHSDSCFDFCSSLD